MNQPLSLLTLFQHLRQQLTSRGYEPAEACAVARHVLEEGFGITQTEVYADKVRDFSAEEMQRLQNICERLYAGIPVQQALGFATFCGHRFTVTPEVLIPRPETQLLAARVVADTPRSVLDVGTGSGCIAISVAKALPGTHVEAWDISETALQVARSNAAALQAHVTFRQADLFHAPSFALSPPPEAIVSNPPYICESERTEMEERVTRHEPALALFVPDANPLVYYRALATLGLRCKAALYVETNRRFAHEVAQLFRTMGYAAAEVAQDQFDNDRFVFAQC